ncbi:RNA polymerase II C-terminal domain phosphatase-like 3 isoform X2 [Nymphaea colorata]|uniref:RNA polymerase II C-terminal domain phosphatase-like 3 isoform X2 n=1 Tax=Nymphaea colorata TaxID=210225 RepID=UPI00129ED202|nr:RNA polymerase II C-terminal domain phosphatase-like 3 isoform X2 [Nymphaea colorata]
MRSGGALCVLINPSAEEEAMARAELGGVDVEEGEISDDTVASEGKRLDRVRESRESGGSRVWGQGYGDGRWMSEFLKFPSTAPKYPPDLYNFAWAQAVQSKPAEGTGLKDIRSDYEKWVSTFVTGGKKEVEAEDVDKVDVEDGEKEGVGGGPGEISEDAEKEEGEIEEGEIEIGDAPEDGTAVLTTEESPVEEVLQEDGSDAELEMLMAMQNSLTEFSVKDSTKSVSEWCFALKDSLEKLRSVKSESCGGKKLNSIRDSIIRQIYDRVHSVYSIYHSSNTKLGEHDKETMLSLLASLSSSSVDLFSRKQIKEFEAMVSYIERDKPVQGMDLRIDLSLPNFDAKGKNDAPAKNVPAPILVNSIERVGGRPEDRFSWGQYETELPSPTPPSRNDKPSADQSENNNQEVPPQVAKNIRVGNDNEDNCVYPCETDVVKAVSSYQQKFLRTSFWSGDRLPSPTPSAEFEVEDGDSNEEVSSSVQNKAVGSLNIPPTIQPLDTAGQKEQLTERILQPIPVTNLYTRAQPKARDPRLRKQKVIDEAVVDGHLAKRQRNGQADDAFSVAVQEVPGKGGWLEESSIAAVSGDSNKNIRAMDIDVSLASTDRMAKKENREVVGSLPSVSESNTMHNKLPASSLNTILPSMALANAVPGLAGRLPAGNVASAAPSASLPALLKGINPAILMQLIKNEQERLAAQTVQNSAIQAQPTSCPPTPVVPSTALPAGNGAPLKASEVDQKPGVAKISTQTVSVGPPMEDSVKVRMKPRDPRRRFLQENVLQKTESLEPKHPEVNSVAMQNLQGRKDLPAEGDQNEQAKRAASLLSSGPLPDISQKLTHTLKSVADILAGSQLTNVTPGIIPGKPSGLVGSGVRDQGNNGIANKGPADDEQGQDLWGDVDHLLEGLDEQQKVAIQKERARRIEEQNKMFAARKLCLVLDLDHTLLNSAKFVEVDPVHDEILRKKEDLDRDKSQRHLFRFAHMGMWTKLRPGIWNFLERASKLYELHLYTMGNKVYATEMAKVLDPTGALFSGRVISKGDDGDPFDGDERIPKSKDLDGVLGMESAVLIIDDSVKVWPHHRHNLILVERYTFFPCSRRQFGLFGPSLLEIDHDERPEDGTLASALAVIERIHHSFFSNQALNSVDVRDILVSEQRRILQGCKIIFSRVFPVGEANPHLHPLWKLAEQFGAVCTNQLDEQVTHVVANSLGTDKVNWAISTGRFVVNPGWLEASALLYRRANEADFAIKP